MHRFIPLAALVLAGCSAFRLPSEPLAVTSDFQPPFDGVVAAVALGAAVYYVIDPKAPNWEVRTTQLDPKRVEIALRMKRFSTGGEGEALTLVRRHASEIAAKAGAGGYELQSYTQGIDSETRPPQRARRHPAAAARLSTAPTPSRAPVRTAPQECGPGPIAPPATSRRPRSGRRAASSLRRRPSASR